ncbi:MAG: acyl carrier protein [Caulobacteraceae bacterium]|nr:acyl carrier protein [Caulobacteraceae bacterium]
MDSIYKRLTEILVDVFDDDDIVATEDLTAEKVNGWDSLAHVRLMIQVERAFSVKFTASEITSFKSVGDLARAIAAKTGRN